jgi:hypothetical protein
MGKKHKNSGGNPSNSPAGEPQNLPVEGPATLPSEAKMFSSPACGASSPVERPATLPSEATQKEKSAGAADETEAVDGFVTVKRRRPHKAVRADENSADTPSKKRDQPDDRTATPKAPKKFRTGGKRRTRSYASAVKSGKNFLVTIRGSLSPLSEDQVAEVDRQVDQYFIDQHLEIPIERVSKQKDHLRFVVSTKERQESLEAQLQNVLWSDNLPTLRVGIPSEPKLRYRAIYTGTRSAEEVRAILVSRHPDMPEDEFCILDQKPLQKGEGSRFILGISTVWERFLESRGNIVYVGTRKVTFQQLVKRRRKAEATGDTAAKASPP